MDSTPPPSSEPLLDVAVTLGLLALTFVIMLGIPLLGTGRSRLPPEEESASDGFERP